MRLFTALKAFFRILFSADAAQRIAEALDGDTLPPPEPPPQAVNAPAPAKTAEKKPARSDAISLLAVLQREGRLIDFLKEDLSGYDDAQVGAAVRDVHRDCSKALERLLSLRPVLEQEEGAAIEVPAGYDPGLFQLSGNVEGQPPLSGSLVHHGWRAEEVALPKWTGSAEAANVVAAAEVEI